MTKATKTIIVCAVAVVTLVLGSEIFKTVRFRKYCESTEEMKTRIDTVSSLFQLMGQTRGYPGLQGQRSCDNRYGVWSPSGCSGSQGQSLGGGSTGALKRIG